MRTNWKNSHRVFPYWKNGCGNFKLFGLVIVWCRFLLFTVVRYEPYLIVSINIDNGLINIDNCDMVLFLCECVPLNSTDSLWRIKYKWQKVLDGFFLCVIFCVWKFRTDIGKSRPHYDCFTDHKFLNCLSSYSHIIVEIFFFAKCFFFLLPNCFNAETHWAIYLIACVYHANWWCLFVLSVCIWNVKAFVWRSY